MRVLVVGCGYIGLPLGERLAREGHEVVGIRRSALARSDLEAAGIQPVIADITRPETLASIPPAFDWVVNCVASTHGADPEDYRRVYLDGARNLLSWLAESPPRKFVYTSSTSVYGQTDGAEVAEESPTQPRSPTSQVLVETERALLAAHRDHGFPAVILRLAGIYGPGRGYWLKRFLAGEAVTEGDRERILNMIHRADVVGAIVAALARSEPGEVFNVVDNEPVRLLDVYRWLAGTLNRPMPPMTPSGGQPKRGRSSGNKRVLNRRLTRQLGYRHQYPTFREGFAAELQGQVLKMSSTSTPL
jgi:nucleoside-diphosphate-sugar epimerase